MRIVVALGGNALLRRGEPVEPEIQRRRLRPVAWAIAALAADHEVLLVHGNGPQVGLLAMESGADPAVGRPYPLGDLVAETQGLIGSWIQQALLDHGCDAVALVTQVVVDGDDPTFDDPRKPIGRVVNEGTARALAADRGWAVRPDGAGWRRVVPSPTPVDVLHVPAARRLASDGYVVVLGGGGGVPLLRHGDTGHGDTREFYEPVEAVVDKDLVAAIVADRVEADALVVLTDVDGVMADFGTPSARLLERLSVAEAEVLELEAGSMAPKVEACADFVRGAPGRRAVIAALERLTDAVAGVAGTQVVPGR